MQNNRSTVSERSVEIYIHMYIHYIYLIKLNLPDSKSCSILHSCSNNQYQLTQVPAINNHVYSNSVDPAQILIAPPIEHTQQQQQQQQQPQLQLEHLQQHEQLQQEHQQQHQHHLQVGEYTHKRRHEFTPTPTTLSCPSQHDSMFTINSDYDAYLLDFPLLGDDFFLYLARMELKCRFKKCKYQTRVESQCIELT